VHLATAQTHFSSSQHTLLLYDNSKRSTVTTMADLNHETGEVSGSRSPRFTQWVAFLVFASITLGSAVQEVSQLFD
jgi:hypothetical protein